MRLTAWWLAMTMSSGCGGPTPQNTTSSTGTTTSSTSTTTTTPTTTTTTGPTTATGCITPNPVYVDCVSEHTHDIYGPVQLSGTTTYDSCGRASVSETYDGSEQLSYVSTWTYFADGRFDRWQWDYAPLDGIPDFEAVFSYDSQSRIVQADYDYGTGVLCTLTFAYIDADDLFDESSFTCNYPGNGEYTEVYTSDPALPERHRHTRRERDNGIDGSFDEIETIAWDAVLDQTTSVTSGRPYSSGVETVVTAWTPTGSVDWIEHDFQSDGVVDYHTDKHEDGDGRTVGWDSNDYAAGDSYSSWIDWTCPGAATTTPRRTPPTVRLDGDTSPIEVAEHLTRLLRP